jgi:hypothetical protein
MPDHLLVVEYDWTMYGGLNAIASKALQEELNKTLLQIEERRFVMKGKGKVKIERSDDNSTESPGKVGAVTKSTPVTRMQPGPTPLGEFAKKKTS